MSAVELADPARHRHARTIAGSDLVITATQDSTLRIGAIGQDSHVRHMPQGTARRNPASIAAPRLGGDLTATAKYDVLRGRPRRRRRVCPASGSRMWCSPGTGGSGPLGQGGLTSSARPGPGSGRPVPSTE
ncbi:hypothetical protein ACFZAV_27365 [Streptomyces sp. NPDC008343]|uniref:hypothetical protein n=1 Tax=Streptomyces sp. NPDC008343 TaxID=3364828 RepID=UPI0036EB5C84